MGGDVAFRDAVPDDVPAIHALVEASYRGDESRRGWTTEADLIDGRRTEASEVARLVSGPGTRMLVGVSVPDAEPDGEPDGGPDGGPDGEIVACCALERRPGGAAYLGMFAVRPQLQGRGTGRRLVARAEEVAASWGCARVVMHVIRQRTELLAWYARIGYLPTGETEPFPYGAPGFHPRRPDLEFAVLARDLPVSRARATRDAG